VEHRSCRWREEIKEAVREGENYDTYSHTLLPLPKTESEKLAMQLVHFRKIESSSLCVQTVPLTREEKAAEVTRRLVYSSKKMEPISVTYLSTSESESGAENSDSDTASKAGTAVKVDGNKWRVVFNNDISMTATDEDLLDPNKFYVERAWMRVDNDDMSKRKQAAKQKRVRQGEQKEQEKRIIEKGLEKLRDAEFSEYNKMREKFESGQGFKFEEFLELLERMRKPFVAQIEGHEVSLTQDDCAIMMESSALHAITETLFVGKEKRCKNSNCNSQEQNKRQRTNSGNQTVRTERGANGLVALYQTEQRNNRLSKQAQQQARTRLNRESKNITTTLTLLASLKQKKPESYWVFSLASSEQEMTMILRLLAPDCGLISKGKQEQWRYIEDKLVPMLSQAVVDAKGEDYS